MKDIKSVVSKNLGTLRKQRGLTQAEVAERLNYSDKAISRWEKGDTLPDINVLYEICQFYGITMNDLVGDGSVKAKEDKLTERDIKAYAAWICAFGGALVWLLSTLLYFAQHALTANAMWIIYIWAIPVSCAVVLFLGKNLFNWIVKFVLLSVISWTTLGSTYLQFIFFSPVPREHAINFWPIFLVGIPVQIMLFLMQKVFKYRKIKKKSRLSDNEEEYDDN